MQAWRLVGQVPHRWGRSDVVYAGGGLEQVFRQLVFQRRRLLKLHFHCDRPQSRRVAAAGDATGRWRTQTSMSLPKSDTAVKAPGSGAGVLAHEGWGKPVGCHAARARGFLQTRLQKGVGFRCVNLENELELPQGQDF